MTIHGLAEAGTPRVTIRKLPVWTQARTPTRDRAGDGGPDLLDQALSIMAAAGVEATVFSDPGLLRAAWSSAAMG